MNTTDRSTEIHPGDRIHLCDGVVFEVMEVRDPEPNGAQSNNGDDDGDKVMGRFNSETAVYTFPAAEVEAFVKGFPVPPEVAELVHRTTGSRKYPAWLIPSLAAGVAILAIVNMVLLFR